VISRICCVPMLAALVLSPARAGERNAPPWEKPVRVGRYLYRENCSICHEIDRAKAGKKFGPSLFRLFQNEKLPLTGGRPTDEYVAGKIKNGGPVMPAFRDYLTDQQVETLMVYIRLRH